MPTLQRLRRRTAIAVSMLVIAVAVAPAAEPQVRIGYVIPQGRTPQPLAAERLQDLMLAVQDWYGDQMERWGYGYKTFQMETLADGVTPLVHIVNTSRTAATIRGDVWGQTIPAAQGAGLPIWSSGQVWLLTPESHMQSPDGSIAGKTALGASNGSGQDPGVAIMESDFLFRASPSILTDNRAYGGLTFPEIGPYPLAQGVSFHSFEGATISTIASAVQGATAHELGHAFGLAHDFRNDQNYDGNHMGNGLRGWRGARLPNLFPNDDMYLSEASAMALNTSRYFNSTLTVTDQTRPTLSISTSGSVAPIDGHLRISFTASDPGQLSAALLRRNGETIGEMSLAGTSASTYFSTPWYTPGQNDGYEISIYDVFGNRRDVEVAITPATGFNRAPQPAIDLGRSTIVAGQAVQLDATRSVDPDGTAGFLTVEWDFDGDGQFDSTPSTSKLITRAFTTPGDFRISARLTDSLGASSISAALMLRVLSGADFNEDGSVDGDDLAAWQAGVGAPGSATHAAGDADNDQDVDGADFLAWQRQVSSGSSIAAVPEPAGISLILVMAAVLTPRLSSAGRRSRLLATQQRRSSHST
jgi:hypothetical protein